MTKKIRRFSRKVYKKLFVRKNIYYLNVPEEKVDQEVDRNLERIKRIRQDAAIYAKPLRSPDLEVTLTGPMKFEWISQEESEREISLDELAMIELEEGKKERDGYRRQEEE